MIQPRLCKNCRHFRNDLINFKKCSLRTTHAETVDLVNGKTTRSQLEYASVVRLSSEVCGVEGKLYEFETDPFLRSLKSIDCLAVALAVLVYIMVTKHQD